MTIESLPGLLLTVRVDVLNDAGIMVVVVAAVIDLELVVGVARDVDGLTAAWAADVAVEVWIDINVDSLAAVVTVLTLALPSPSKASIPFC